MTAFILVYRGYDWRSGRSFTSYSAGVDWFKSCHGYADDFEGERPTWTSNINEAQRFETAEQAEHFRECWKYSDVGCCKVEQVEFE